MFASGCVEKRDFCLEKRKFEKSAVQVINQIPGWWVPVLYVNSALLFGLSNLLHAPRALYVPSAAAWCAALVLHALSKQGWWLACGCLLTALFPCVVALDDAWAAMAYVVLFASFAGGAFWKDTRGPLLVLMFAAWIGVGVTLGAHAGGALRVREMVTVSAFLALFLAVTGARNLGKVTYKVVLVETAASARG